MTLPILRKDRSFAEPHGKNHNIGVVPAVSLRRKKSGPEKTVLAYDGIAIIVKLE